jgi:hypothetical protein
VLCCRKPPVDLGYWSSQFAGLRWLLTCREL